MAARTALGDVVPGPDLRRSEEKARLAALARRRAEAVPEVAEGSGWEIRLGDFREVLADLPDGAPMPSCATSVQRAGRAFVLEKSADDTIPGNRPSDPSSGCWI